MKHGILLSNKKLKPGIFVLVQFRDTGNNEEYLEIGIIRKNIMRKVKIS